MKRLISQALAASLFASVALAAVPPIPPGPTATVAAGTNISVTGTAPNYTVNSTVVVPSYAAGSGISVTGSSPSYTINNTQTIPNYAAGSGISVTGTTPNFTINNTAVIPSYTAGTGISITGTTPNFTITNSVTAPVGANPTGSVGAAAVNGVATTFMRSDAAPALGAGAALANLGGAGQLTGTATNDNAAAGKVGEYICAQVTNGGTPTGCATNVNVPVAVTSATATNITSLSLTAGDWDVSGTVATAAAGSSSAPGGHVAYISTVSATLPTSPNGGGYTVAIPASTVAGLATSAGSIRLSLASTTTVYLGTYIAYTGTGVTMDGYISARRAR